MYLRALKWLGVNARCIGVVITNRRLPVIGDVLPDSLSAICDGVLVSLCLWGRIAVDLVPIAILSRPPKTDRRAAYWRESI